MYNWEIKNCIEGDIEGLKASARNDVELQEAIIELLKVYIVKTSDFIGILKTELDKSYE